MKKLLGIMLVFGAFWGANAFAYKMRVVLESDGDKYLEIVLDSKECGGSKTAEYCTMRVRPETFKNQGCTVRYANGEFGNDIGSLWIDQHGNTISCRLEYWDKDECHLVLRMQGEFVLWKPVYCPERDLPIFLDDYANNY